MVHNLFVAPPASGKGSGNLAACSQVEIGLRLRGVEMLTLVRHSAGAGIDKIDLLNTPLRRFPRLSRKLQHFAPLGRRDPLHSLVKPFRNIELNYRCHHILHNVLFRQPGEGNSDAKL